LCQSTSGSLGPKIGKRTLERGKSNYCHSLGIGRALIEERTNLYYEKRREGKIGDTSKRRDRGKKKEPIATKFLG